MINQVPSNGLSPLEQSLVERVVRGELLDLAADDDAVDESAMRSWGDSRTCRASVIRDILRGRLAADPDPHGLRLRGARITGRLDLENLQTDVNIELSCCLLEQGVLARDARLRFLGMTGCQIEHPSEPPLDCARLTCTDLHLEMTRIVGHSRDGTVNLEGARVGGRLNCDGAELYNDSGPALMADSLRVAENVLLRRGFVAAGSGEHGTVRLLAAHVGGQFACDGTLRNDSGSGLVAARLQVDQGMYLRDGFTAVARGHSAAVNLMGARIGGTFECVRAEISNDSGAGLDAEGMQVGEGMFLRSLTARGGGGGKGAALDLTDTRVGGPFLLAAVLLEHEAGQRRRLKVDGLTYVGVPEPMSAEEWRELVRQDTPGYAAQPYQQLAAGYRAMGDDRQVRETLMAQRDDQLARTNPRRAERWWGKITKVTLGYGYQPWRALLFLAAVVAASCVVAVMLGAHGALAQTSQTATPGRSCTVVQQVSVGLDLNLPVGTTVARVDCDLTRDSVSATAAWLTAVGWIMRLLAWAFAALFIAGFTSAVRRT